MTSLDIHQLDSQYRRFPSFAEWQKCKTDTVTLESHMVALKDARSKASAEILKRAFEIVRRAAAVDTGAIEGLYQVDRGFTLTVAMQAATWQSALETKGPKVRSMIESQLQVYESILDMATYGTPVVETWIRALHEQLCRAQETYTVYTAVGPQEQVVPLGEYKTMPNHVRRKDGTTFSYAPVDVTPQEMQRLLQELNSREFLEANYVLQASYAHYALVHIHPFTDGNGRVARALASVYMYRAAAIPFLLLLQDKQQYLEALEQADAGHYQGFVDFTLLRVIDAITLVAESIHAAATPQPEEAKARILDLFTTKGGYTHADIDQAGQKLFSAFVNEVSRSGSETAIPNILAVGVGTVQGAVNWNVQRANYRTYDFCLRISFRTEQPVETTLQRSFVLEVPRDAGTDDELFIQSMEHKDQYFGARMRDLWPNIRDFVQMRLNIFTKRIIGDGLNALHAQARGNLNPPAS